MWKDAEKIKICPGRSYLSMKERYRKTILKNIKSYKIDKNLICKILEFQRATQAGQFYFPSVEFITTSLF